MMRFASPIEGVESVCRLKAPSDPSLLNNFSQIECAELTRQKNR